MVSSEKLCIYMYRGRRRRVAAAAHPPPPPSIHVYTLFFRIEKNHPGIVFFC
jgi:hypothetical protein